MFSGIVSSIDFYIVGVNLVSSLSCPSLSEIHHIRYLLSTCIRRVDFRYFIFFMTLVAKFLYTSLWLGANHFVGSAVILYFPAR
jgi:hypothetical protein